MNIPVMLRLVYMWRVDQIKRLVSLLVIFLAVVGLAFSQNQPVKIIIEIPAGVGISKAGNGLADGSDGNGSGADASGIDSGMIFPVFTENGTLLPLYWLKLQSFEDSQFLLDFSYANENSQLVTAYFLNDQSGDLQLAQKLPAFPFALNFNRDRMLIRNVLPKRIFFNAWLGFTIPNTGVTAIIEYL